MFKGRVLDNSTNEPVGGATIFLNDKAASASSKDGWFRIYAGSNDKNITLKITHISYKTKTLEISGNNPGIIELEPKKDITLETVIVSTDALIILKKAIAAIPKNYPPKGAVLNGVVRRYDIANHSDYFYKTEGIVRVFVPPSTATNKDIKIELVQNKSFLQEDKNSRFINSPERPSWTNSFHSTSEVVIDRARFLNPNYLNQYYYVNHGKTRYRNRTVYWIGFQGKTKKTIEGNIYIDSASYAITGVNYSRYNIRRLIFMPLSVSKVVIEYDKIGSYWYLAYNHLEAVAADANDLRIIEDFSLHKVEDSTGTLKPDYMKVMARRLNDETVQKPGPDSVWTKYDKIINDPDSGRVLTYIPTPNLTNPVTPRGKPNPLIPVFEYMRNGNIYVSVGLGQFPYQINNNAYKKIAEYGVFFDSRFRIIKNLYLGSAAVRSYGLTGVKAKYNSYYLSYDFALSQKGKTILSPYSGYSITKFKENHIQYRFKNWSSGLDISYAISPKGRFFIRGDYHHLLSQKGSHPNILPQSYSISLGVRFKL